MADIYLGEGRRTRRTALIFVFVAIVILLLASRYIASTILDYEWWSSIGQADTWLNLLLYTTVPVALATAFFWAVFAGAFLLAWRHQSRDRLFGFLEPRLVTRLVLLGLLVVAWICAGATVNGWTVVRFFGGVRIPTGAHEYVDPIFHAPLHFYFFSLPFYKLLLSAVFVASIGGLLIHWIASNLQALAGSFQGGGPGAMQFTFEQPRLRLVDSSFVRLAGAVFLLCLAAKIFLDRFDLLFVDHGTYLVGVDWLADHLVIPLQWCMIAGAVIAAALVLLRHARWAVVLLAIPVIRFILPPIVGAVYVRPNELAVERPYIAHHIEATRAAYGLNRNVREENLEAAPEIPIDYNKHQALLSNVRLWDWRAFHDTISQIQPLRPYFYYDTDVDRYMINGQLRQVLLSARELDTRQLGEAQNRWINSHLMYTHGYGLVMAEANRITPDGLPLLFVQNAPPEVTSPSLKLTQPDIYFGEISHEPVYVNTNQPEFDYPSGSESVYTHYSGPGGFPVGSLGTRLAAALEYGDANVLLSSYLTGKSRIMIHRPILERIGTLAGFLAWDPDPYIVLTASGHLVWIADGYMTSDAHPYSRAVNFQDGGANYIRNSVKATIDAYTGEVNFYVFDPADPLIQAYRELFPKLFKPMSAMPADIRMHARYPEALFSAQAEIYRTFHMRDPEAFYNRADLWDLARTPGAQGDLNAMSPTYVVASLPHENEAEFLLLTPFTPAGKDNLIGVMLARCDGDHLGELVFEQLSKQNIVFGPIQIDARINQDQTISKDLTLWNQQGSQVLRGQTLVLPIENSFLYVEPIYIQASQASMPQLKKVALAMGNKLAYADTYEQALNQLIGELGGGTQAPQGQPAPAQPSPAAQQAQTRPSSQNHAVQTLGQIRDHLARYRELSAQGKWSEAGKELDAIQQLLQK